VEGKALNSTFENLQTAYAEIRLVLATEPDNHQKLLAASKQLADAVEAQIQKDSGKVDVPDFLKEDARAFRRSVGKAALTRLVE
jgi:hypothetical protein